MRKTNKRVVTVLFALLLVMIGLTTTKVKAAESEIIVHVKDGSAWGAMNAYNWGDGGEILGPWPGAKLEADSMDGWYKTVIKTQEALNLVFSNNGTPQSGDVKDISPDSKEIWIVIGSEGEKNDLGTASNEAIMYTAPEAGWPATGDANMKEVEETVDGSTKKDDSTDSTTIIVVIAVIAMVSLIGVAVIIVKKNRTK